MQRTITAGSDEVSKFQNVPGTISKLFSIKTPQGVKYRYAPPMKVILKLYDVDGNQVEPQADLQLGFQSPAARYPEFFRSFDYSRYYDLDEGQQRNRDYAENVTFMQFDNQVRDVIAKEGATLQLWSESAAQINLDDPRTRLEIVAEELPA